MFKTYLFLSVVVYSLTFLSPFYLVAGTAFAILSAVQHYTDLRPLHKRMAEQEERLSQLEGKIQNLGSTVSFMRNGGNPKK